MGLTLKSVGIFTNNFMRGRSDMAGDKWIQKAIPKSHKGALHKEMGIAQDKKIPAAKLAKAAKSSNPKLARRARLAQTLKKINRGGRSK